MPRFAGSQTLEPTNRSRCSPPPWGSAVPALPATATTGRQRTNNGDHRIRTRRRRRRPGARPRRGAMGGGTPYTPRRSAGVIADQLPQPPDTHPAPQAPTRAPPGEGAMGEELPTYPGTGSPRESGSRRATAGDVPGFRPSEGARGRDSPMLGGSQRGALPLAKAVCRRCREPVLHLFARYQCKLVHDNGNFTAHRLRNYHHNENVIVIMALPAGTVKRTAIGNPTLPLN